MITANSVVNIHVGHVALVALTEPHSLFSVKN
jgi:hypothetical protein